MVERNTDVYHITVAGINPHNFASTLRQEGNPFYELRMGASVFQHILDDRREIVGGIVDVWVPEHMTVAQEAYLHSNPHVIDIRHVYPEDRT